MRNGVMKIDFYREQIDNTPLVPPYADVDSYTLGPLRATITFHIPIWLARWIAHFDVRMTRFEIKEKR